QVTMTFTPETGYHWLLGGAALALCVLIAGALWPPRRRRAHGPAPRHLRSAAPGGPATSVAPGPFGGTVPFSATGSPGTGESPGTTGSSGTIGSTGSTLPSGSTGSTSSTGPSGSTGS